MNQCLSNYIGIKGDCLPVSPTPISGRYINDLPGINLESASDTRDVDYTSAYAFLSDLINRTLDEEAIGIGEAARPYTKLIETIETDYAGEWTNGSYLASENVDKGVNICIRQTKMSRIFIHSIDVLTNTTINGKTISIKDGDGATTAYSVDLVAGQISTVEINQQMTQDTAYAFWNTSDITPNESYLKSNNCTGCGSNGSWKGSKYFDYATVKGQTDTETSLNETFGMRVNFSIVCDPELVACSLKNIGSYKLMMLYACGVKFAQEALKTQRYNPITNLFRAEWEKELNEEISGSWISHYNKHKDALFGNIKKTLNRMDSSCMHCNEPRVVMIQP